MNPSRSTSRPTFLDLVNLLGRGGTDDWRHIYQHAKTDVELQGDIEAAIPLIDPDLGSSGTLWTFLLEHVRGLGLTHEVKPKQQTRSRG